ncbi:MAG: non-heme chloroperoxidase [Kiritimatiellia bacterium]|jgi:non-heme chloroperoxidase
MELELSENQHLHIHERPGDGPTVVLVHGWAVTGRVWSSVFERWDGPERLLAVDLRGTGWSSKPRTGYTIQAYSRDVIALIKHLDTPVVLVGHSMGGAIAQWVASAVPDRIVKLVLVSPVPASGAPMPDDVVTYLRSLAGHKEGVRSVITSMLHVQQPDGLEQMVQDCSTVAIEAYLEGLDAFRGANFADRLSAVTAPVHVMGGAKEQPLNPDVLKVAVVAAYPNATFEQIPGVGHYPHIEAPDLFTSLLQHAVR